jgi:hypothetical protein
MFYVYPLFRGHRGLDDGQKSRFDMDLLSLSNRRHPPGRRAIQGGQTSEMAATSCLLRFKFDCKPFSTFSSDILVGLAPLKFVKYAKRKAIMT